MADRPFELGGVRWRLPADRTAEQVRPLLERALARLPEARDEKRGRRKSLYRLRLADGEGPPDHLLKVSRYPLQRLPWPRRAKARRELRLAEAAAARGIPVPVPLAAGEAHRGGRLERCLLLVPILPDVVDLRELWFAGTSRPAERRELARALGALARRLHDAGLHQDDFQPNNFLVRRGAEPRLWVIDFERARLRRRVGARLRRRALAKLDRELARAPASQRLRFLQAYAGSAAEARALWQALAGELPRLARRDERRLRRTAVRSGRRFRRLRLDGWTGWAQAGADDARLARALAGGAGAPGALRSPGRAQEWVLGLHDGSVAGARRVWSTSLALAQRQLAPRPLAVLCGRDGAVLVLERPERVLGSDELRRTPVLEAAARALARRLRDYGELAPPAARPALAVRPDGPDRVRAWLLAVESFRCDGRPGAALPAQRAEELLAGVAERASRPG